MNASAKRDRSRARTAQQVPNAPTPLERTLALTRARVVHDLNNILSAMRGYLYLLAARGDRRSRAALGEVVQGMEWSCDRLGMVADELILLDGDASGAVERCALEPVVSEAIALVARTSEAALSLDRKHRAAPLSCGVDARVLRALVTCVLRVVADVAQPRVVYVALLQSRGRKATLRIRARVPRETQIGALDPQAALERDPAPGVRHGLMLWEARCALAARSGRMRIERRGSWITIALELP